MKHTRGSLLKSRDPVDILYKRLLDMMYDYGVSLKEAIEWDMSGFMPFPLKDLILTPEEEVLYYLELNGIPEHNTIFFSGVALGHFPDYGLTDDEEETEQKDVGSPGSS